MDNTIEFFSKLGQTHTQDSDDVMEQGRVQLDGYDKEQFQPLTPSPRGQFSGSKRNFDNSIDLSSPDSSLSSHFSDSLDTSDIKQHISSMMQKQKQTKW